MLAMLALICSPVLAATGQQEITSAGPLTRIIISNDLNCQVAHRDDTEFELFGTEIGGCGTFLAVNGVLFGPSEVPAGAFTLTSWAPVSQSAVAGSGTQALPYQIVTVVDAPTAGVRLEQTDSYVVGTQSYRTDVTITNSGPAALSGVLYRAGDCYLQESDVGFGRVDSGAPACIVDPTVGHRIEQWTPLTPGSHFMEGDFSDVWQHVDSQQQLPDTCLCLDTAVDNGAGLSWPVTVPSGQSATISHETFFSPVGRGPVQQSFTQSVPDPLHITLDPIVVAQTVAVTAGVILLVPFPSALFNSTLEENYEEVMTGVGRVRAWLAATWARFAAWVRRQIAAQQAARAAARQATVMNQQPPLGQQPLGQQPPVAQEPPVGQLPMTYTPPQAQQTAPVVGRAAAAASPTPDQPTSDFWSKPLGVVTFVLLSALFYAFLDPTFGFSVVSLATFLGLALGLIVILVAYGAPLVIFSHNHSIGLTVRALPATLIVAAACVVISRVSNFQPGYLYGLVVGFFFAHSVARDIEGKAEAAAAGASLGAAFLAWVALALLHAGLGPSGEFISALLQAATVTIVVAGLENAVFAMLPLRFLPGAAVYAWDRRVWIVLIGLGIFGFAHVLLNPSAGAGYLADTSRTSFLTLVVLLVAFGIASVIFWAWFRFRPSSRAHPHGPAL